MPPCRPLPPPHARRPEALRDPLRDRQVPHVPPPPSQLLTADLLFDRKGKPDLDLLIEHLNLEGLLSQELVFDIIRKAVELFDAEPNLLRLDDPITVVGDIHGQYFDLVKLFEVGGPVGHTQYVFLGDYVDRGSFSCEVLSLLFTLKIMYPKRVRLLRGNHECRQMTSCFGFRDECEYKYDSSVYQTFMEAFDTLPVAALINGKFLVMHGGISPELRTLQSLNALDRVQEPPKEGLLCDVLWSDPWSEQMAAEFQQRPGRGSRSFVPNEVRGCSFYFSSEDASKFLEKNSLLSVIRAHEAQIEGYRMHDEVPTTGFPSVITIFSAPNYCDVYNNRGAILKIEHSTVNILQFDCTSHPYHLPKFMDILAWSMPFVIEKSLEILHAITKRIVDDDDDDVDDFLDDDLDDELPAAFNRKSLSADKQRTVNLVHRIATSSGSTIRRPRDRETVLAERRMTRERMQTQLVAIGKLAHEHRRMRKKNETVLHLRGVTPGHNLEPELLLDRDRLRDGEKFKHATGIDAVNEKRPLHRPGSPRSSHRRSMDHAEVFRDGTRRSPSRHSSGQTEVF